MVEQPVIQKAETEQKWNLDESLDLDVVKQCVNVSKVFQNNEKAIFEKKKQETSVTEDNAAIENTDSEIVRDAGFDESYAVPKMSSYVRAEKKKRGSKTVTKPHTPENPQNPLIDEAFVEKGSFTHEIESVPEIAQETPQEEKQEEIKIEEPVTQSQSPYMSLEEFIASGGKVTNDSAVFDPETGERMNVVKLARLVMKALNATENSTTEESNTSAKKQKNVDEPVVEKLESEPVHAPEEVQNEPAQEPVLFDRDTEVARLILMLLNSGWLKRETGTPGTLANEVERILAIHKVVVETGEVITLMQLHGFKQEDNNPLEDVPQADSKSQTSKQVALDTKTLNNVNWNESDPEMDAVVNKEVDGVPVVFLSYVKQIEEEVNTESTTKAINAICEQLKKEGGCTYAANSFRKCDLKKLWNGIRNEYPVATAEWTNERIVISVF